MHKQRIVVIGGGAAGFFGAIRMAEKSPDNEIIILEAGNKLLSKVRISGGGRCNVTHDCMENSELIRNYPRGDKALRQVFSRFTVSDIVAWFNGKGVELKTEADGRMFPSSNDSATIVNCFIGEAERLGINIRTGVRVTEIIPGKKIEILGEKGQRILADKVLVTTGGNASKEFYNLFRKIGHTIHEPVPSLFTFNIRSKDLHQLMGISMQDATVRISGTKFSESGAMLITHWGLSGPAVLKLSSLAARDLAEKRYEFNVSVSWSSFTSTQLDERIAGYRINSGSKKLKNLPLISPIRLWEYLIERAGITEHATYADLNKKAIVRLISTLSSDEYNVSGKTTFKEEFVTCGGVSLDEVNMKTMESKKVPGLFFAGEVLDIDGLTGGFNFQSAWSTAAVAADSIIP